MSSLWDFYGLYKESQMPVFHHDYIICHNKHSEERSIKLKIKGSLV